MESWQKILLILAAFCCECRGEETVIQPPGDVIPTEGEQVTLGCQFDTVDRNPYLFWYKQRANDFPKFMLKRVTFGSDNAIEFQRRFDAHLNLTTFKSESKSVPLTIQRLQLSDSAVYYCALRPTVTTGYTGCRAEENVIQPTKDVMVVEGQPIKLTCLFDTTSQSPYLFWYKQQTNSNPMFMLRRDTFGAGETATEFKERFHARLNVTAKSVPLTIQRVQLSDSAVYYCALRPTVTTGYTAILQKLYVSCVSHGNDITPTTDKVFGLEGDVINLSCNYSSASTLQWYQQYPGSSPIFLLLTGVSSNPSVVHATPPYPRLSVKLNDERTHVDLEMSSAEVTDSALYYCAL
ncbi:uncharacterized protein [Salmo salar]|uniref:Ig-like domain-containing protein n=1 Tax=Salmo salar TaxID=8030 RepID=A0ABM3CST9_SALSA|nr:uncharacterized protein LOC106569058 [Salmo salar]